MYLLVPVSVYFPDEGYTSALWDSRFKYITCIVIAGCKCGITCIFRIFVTSALILYNTGSKKPIECCRRKTRISHHLQEFLETS